MSGVARRQLVEEKVQLQAKLDESRRESLSWQRELESCRLHHESCERQRKDAIASYEAAERRAEGVATEHAQLAAQMASLRQVADEAKDANASLLRDKSALTRDLANARGAADGQ